MVIVTMQEFTFSGSSTRVVVRHDDADRATVEASTLKLYSAKDKLVAAYAPGVWREMEVRV